MGTPPLRGLPRNVLHLLTPPTQVALLAPLPPPQNAGPPPNANPTAAAAPPTAPPGTGTTLGLPLAQVPPPLVNSGGVVKIVVRHAPPHLGPC